MSNTSVARQQTMSTAAAAAAAAAGGGGVMSASGNVSYLKPASQLLARSHSSRLTRQPTPSHIHTAV